MCLYSRKTPIEAEEDIHVWKVVSVDGCPPYYSDFKYEKGKVHVPTEAPVVREAIYDGSGVYKYEWGWLHSYSDKTRAIEMAETLAMQKAVSYGESGCMHVIELVIPKGAKYVAEGDEIASDALEWEEDAKGLEVWYEPFYEELESPVKGRTKLRYRLRHEII